MRAITLKHPEKDITITEYAELPFQFARIKKRWKQTYGKLYDRCTVTIIKREVKVIQHIESEKIFYTARKAGKQFGMSRQTVLDHANCRSEYKKVKRLFQFVTIDAA